ncbi:MAG: helix-turn-helix transcriptional regulator [Desulfuromusa sp.]|nr:helix-turn-helix transcriptional regulator [Desulfuromusa sp.]
MEPLNPPAVAIDGNVIRRIREEKRLTQLYIAKVVGVTTDTVSRWENNRYPTILRDNALKLAEGLEVDLAEILKKEEVADNPDAEMSRKSKKQNWIYFLLLFGVTLAALVFLLLPPDPPSAVPVLQAKRFLPPFAAPGSRILIQVKLSAEKPLRGMILKETFPPRWHLIESEPVVSHLDADTGVARWIFRKPLLKTAVYYILEVPEVIEPDSDLTISGELIANPEGQRSSALVQSVGTMQLEPFHWTDKNGDWIIDDLEILELSDLTEEAQSLNLDWDLIEMIWETGAYRWDNGTKNFTPVQPVSE